MTGQDGDVFDLSYPRRVHVVGAGGPGMSAIAIVLAQMGHRVSASDQRETPVLERVRMSGVEVFVGHRVEAVHGCDAVTWSPAVPAHNVERVAAENAGIPMLDRAAMLAAICARARSVGVAGTHGKTTTSSLVRAMLDADVEAGPTSFLIGGDLLDLGTGARWTGSDLFVVEADESDGTHVRLPLSAGIVTNVDVDHLDHFGTFDAIVESFVDFLVGLGAPRVVNLDDPVSAAMLSRLPEVGTVTYGTDPRSDWRWSNVAAVGARTRFDLRAPDGVVRVVDLPLRGAHNVSNCCGAVALVAGLGVDPARRSRRPRRSGESAAASRWWVSTGGRRSSTTTRIFRARSRPCCAPRDRVENGAASWPCSSRTDSIGSRRWPTSTDDASSMPTRSW